MSRINWGRFWLCGVVIFIVTAIFENVANGLFFVQPWTAAMTALGKPALGIGQVIAFNVYGLVLAFTTAWVYVAIRPRFGGSIRTAISAALVVFILAYVLGYALPAILDLLPLSLVIPLAIVGLVEIVVGTVAGAYFYREV